MEKAYLRLFVPRNILSFWEMFKLALSLGRATGACSLTQFFVEKKAFSSRVSTCFWPGMWAGGPRMQKKSFRPQALRKSSAFFPADLPGAG
jgi:hypothetical protein